MKKCTLNRVFLIFICFLIYLQVSVAYAKHRIIVDEQQDTTTIKANDSTKDVQTTGKDAAKKPLLKKITDLFKFKRNAQEKEKKRIIEIVDAMDITDTVKAQIDELRKLITAVTINDTMLYRELLRNINTVLALQTDKTNQSALASAEAVKQARDAYDLITRQIANLPLPPSTNIDAKPIKIQTDVDGERTKATAVRNLLEINTKTINAAANGTVTLQKKALIHAFCSTSGSPDYTTTRFNLYDAYVFDALALNGKTGAVTGSTTTSLLDSAHAAGSKVFFTIAVDRSNGQAFLKNETAQHHFIELCAGLLEQYNANGINLYFKGLPATSQPMFNKMLANIAEQLQSRDASYQVCLTLPAYQQGTFDLSAIDQYVTYYYIDFSIISSGALASPLAPISGFQNNNITTSLAYYLNLQIPASKFIAKLPYRGTVWTLYPEPKQRNEFNRYISYKEIRQRYNWPVQYDESRCAYMDTIYNGIITRRIWFDDDKTLGQKYDQVLQSGLAGVGIAYLGNDGSYGELTNMLLYKFFEADSTAKPAPPPASQLSFWQKTYRRLALYHYILNNPCEMCFEDNEETHGNTNNIYQYVKDLNIDSAVIVTNNEILKENKGKDTIDWKPLTTDFLYMNDELSRLTWYASLFFLLLSGAVTALYINRLRLVGENWKYKKATAITLTALIVALMYFVFAFLFTKDWIPVFTISDDTEAMKGIYFNKAANKFRVPDGYCEPDKGCVNIPLHTLIGTILLGALLGLALGKYLLLPVFKRKEVP